VIVCIYIEDCLVMGTNVEMGFHLTGLPCRWGQKDEQCCPVSLLVYSLFLLHGL